MGTNLLKPNHNTLKLLSLNSFESAFESAYGRRNIPKCSKSCRKSSEAKRKSYAFDSDEVDRYKVTSMMSTRQSELLLALNQSNQLG